MRLVRLLSLAAAATACSVIGPEITLPPDAVQSEPLPVYEEWYAEAQLCTRVSGRYADVRWFRVPHERWWDPVWEQFAIGTWRAPHDIYLAESHLDNEQVVKHEIVHDLLQGGRTGDRRFKDCSGITH